MKSLSFRAFMQAAFAALRTRHIVGWRTLPIAVTITALAACGDSSGGGVTISGDVAGLDTLALRGDSLIAQAGRAPRAIDSLRAIAAGAVTRAHTPSKTGTNALASASTNANGNLAAKDAATASTLTAMPGANPMSIRAQARGDAMARAAALKLVAVNAGGRSRSDTVRGIVTLIGTAPAPQVVLRTVDGAIVAMSGMATSGLSRLAGSEIVIRGVRVSPRDVVVSDFIVRAANGQPAMDGKLEGGGGGWYLQMTDGSGRKPLVAVPAGLQNLQGSRVWIATKRGAPMSFGAIGRRY